MDDQMVNMYRAHESGSMGRREFFRRLTLLTGSAAGALAMMPLIRAHAQQVAADDPRLDTEMIEYDGASGKVQAYLARPKGEEKHPGVIVIHENKGLQPHIRDVTRRMALEGFQALAPDALSPKGGTPEEVDKARTMMRELDSEKTTGDFVAAVQYLKTHPLSTGKVGCTGFCWGGAMTNQVAVRSPDLIAAVPYYGRQPAVEDVPKTNAAFLLQYAGLDERINRGIPEFEEALKKADIEYKVFIYEGAKHAFNNDTNESRYHKEAAELAWKRTVSFFKEKLKE